MTAVLVGTACEGEREQAERAAAARISRAVDLVRQADNERKQPHLLALQAAECGTAKRVCALQNTCAGAYDQYIQGLRELSVARRGAANDAAAAQQAAMLLSQAERRLNSAKPALDRCVAQQGAVRRHYDL